ncbi:DUF3017 domain-containing protein [Allobranchiibius sp. GilTou73]|uniref:DUF3017 domain-containing protein n=1 Tax=Allobranchiibius sp. GilTou73 TaxID=2904523 RepID=UPI001F23E1ED|nr:DUF3017 domain-containing protein [Allobranchiibius sp. GilTou73]UIJ36265.1 DUF3017 domain-containing protein [Allobranchiibius sp. GilTou73]
MKPARLGPAWWTIALASVVALLIAYFGSLRAGGYALAVVLLLAAFLRLLPASVTDGLAVRSRMVDVLTLCGFALAIVVIFAVVKI